MTEMVLLPGWHNLVQQRLQSTAALPVAHGGVGPELWSAENAMGHYVRLLSPRWSKQVDAGDGDS